MTRNTCTYTLIHPQRASRWALVCLAALLMGVPAFAGEDTTHKAPATIRWGAIDTAGNPVVVPKLGRISVVLFVRADQKRSEEAMGLLGELLTGAPGEAEAGDVQVIAVVSGHDAGVGALKLKGSGKCPWPIVVDTDYEASGLMSVRVWPSTVIVDGQGNQIVRMAGLRESYAKDLRAYLAFARGTLDEAGLRQRLTTHSTVTSTSSRVASRHLHLAEKLLEAGRVGLAREELERGLAIEPNDVKLHLTLAKVRVMLGQPAEALAILDALDADIKTAWRVQTLRGRALVGLERFDEARIALAEALKINPDPAEAYYFLGRVHEQAGQWQRAAVAYRHAFEKSVAAEGLGADEVLGDR